MSTIGAAKIRRGIFLSVFAQLVSVSVSLIFSLFVPKFIPPVEYANWQTFVLYVAYVGLFHFGLLDGIILRYSQYDYGELDLKLIRSQYRVLFFFTLILAAAGTTVALLFFRGTAEGALLVLLSAGTVTKNLFCYTSYTFQITNRIGNYAFLIIAQRVVNGIGVVALLLLGVDDFIWYCVAELAGDLVGSLIAAIRNRGLYLGAIPPLGTVFREIGRNISAGFMLLVANWSSIFLIGSAKMTVDWRWDKLIFGKVSFAFSVSNLFLTFVSAVSVVLFPSLKRTDPERLPGMYREIRGRVSPILFFALLFYFPGCAILSRWLPAYRESLFYLGLLLPVIVYASKVSLLTDNYLKAYRREKTMLAINLSCIAVALTAFALCAFVFDSLTGLLVAAVVMVALRSVLSEIAVGRVIGEGATVPDFVAEAVLSVGFILSARFLSLPIGALVYGLLFIPYLILHRRDLVSLFIRNKKPDAESGARDD